MCQSCGYESAKWMGKCPGCGEWNKMVEEVEIVKPQDAEEPLRIQMESREQPSGKKQHLLQQLKHYKNQELRRI